MSRFILGMVLGAVLTLIVVQLRVAWQYQQHAPQPARAAQPRPMREVTLAPAMIRDGQPQVRNATFARTSGGSAVAGVWHCQGPAVVDVAFPQDEWLYVLSGEVEVSYLERTFRLGPGDAAVFLAGTTATWRVPESIEKVWLQHDPGPAARFISRDPAVD